MEHADRLKAYIENTLGSADTDLERLIFLGSLRDSYTGRYLHEGLSGMAGAEEIHLKLQECHRLIFTSILCVPVLQVSRELRRHFEKSNEPERETSLRWLDIEPFRDFIPERCPPTLRELFISQLRSALEVLSRVPEWTELKAPGASPLPQPDQSPQPHWVN